MRQHDYPSHRAMVERLSRHYDRATEADRAAGRAWYPEARRFIRTVADAHGLSRSTVAGVVAALSPRTRWSANRRMALQCIAHGTPGADCLRRNAENAARILSGEHPRVVLRGPKTRAFYLALVGDNYATVIDTWMLHAVGWPTTDGGVKPTDYERIADALRDAAERAGEKPAPYQATVWVVVRGKAE